jgi:hypothetical protein
MEGEYFPFEELNQAWVEATENRGHTSYIRAADAGTARELIKYVTKLADLIGDAAALDEFLTAVFRKRLVRTYGTFYDLPVEDEDNPHRECPDCKSRDLTRLGIVPSHQISLDLKGVFRVNRSQRDVDRELRENAEFYPAFLQDGRQVSRRAHPRSQDAHDREFKQLVRTFAATSRTKGEVQQWQQHR